MPLTVYIPLKPFKLGEEEEGRMESLLCLIAATVSCVLSVFGNLFEGG